MSFINKFKEMMGSNEEYAEDADYPVEGNYDDAPQDDYAAGEEPSPKRNKVVNINSTMQLQVVLVKPEHFEDASAVADHLNAKRTVVLNLESASPELSRRLLDFLSGVAFANHGEVQRVANATFIILPSNVNLMGNLLDELEDSGVYF